MLWTVLPSQLLEFAAQQLFAMDPASAERLQKLTGKRVRVTLRELGKPLTVTVTDTSLQFSWVDDDAVDCHISTELAVLPELRDSANITRLIKADKLDIEGDPLLAQQLSKLVTALDIDWPEQLSQRIGDVPAQLLVTAFQRSRKRFGSWQQDNQQWLRDALVEEKKILPARPQFTQFQQDIQALRARIDKLERQLRKPRD
ncbi:ubiquinone biosynthesis accessory factor UbiJ [Pseudidiomarina insulisalsae]|nr:SCP2 sterol-binding domain-containing protein [Pseudidiomarina insulisalsae]